MALTQKEYTQSFNVTWLCLVRLRTWHQNLEMERTCQAFLAGLSKGVRSHDDVQAVGTQPARPLQETSNISYKHSRFYWWSLILLWIATAQQLEALFLTRHNLGVQIVWVVCNISPCWRNDQFQNVFLLWRHKSTNQSRVLLCVDFHQEFLPLLPDPQHFSK